MRARIPIMGVVSALILGYAAYPYVALYQLKHAVEQGDRTVLSQLIDWPAVREGIKEDICDLVLEEPKDSSTKGALPPFGASFVRGVAGTAIDRSINPEAFVAVTHTPVAAEPAVNEVARINWAFFTGPGSFRIDVIASGVAEPIRIDMELQGLSWLVRRVSLPPSVLESGQFRT